MRVSLLQGCIRISVQGDSGLLGGLLASRSLAAFSRDSASETGSRDQCMHLSCSVVMRAGSYSKQTCKLKHAHGMSVFESNVITPVVALVPALSSWCAVAYELWALHTVCTAGRMGARTPSGRWAMLVIAECLRICIVACNSVAHTKKTRA